MSRYAIVPARVEHIPHVAENMREADRVEIRAMTRQTPYEALEQGLRDSSHVWAGTADDVPFCLFGVAPLTLLSGTGVPWMLGTDSVKMHARAFLRHNRPVVETMRKPYRRLENWVDARNVLSIRWLRWLGFTIEKPEPIGRDGELFHCFRMEGYRR